MISLDFDKTYSYADYLTWRFEERVELIKGKLFKMSPAPATRHQRISRRLMLHVGNWVEDRDDDCELFDAPFDVRLSAYDAAKDEEVTTVVQPDLCIVCNPAQIDDKGCVGAPSLVIEILSKHNPSHDLKTKHALYQEHGVQEYWVVAPDYNHVQVYLLNNDGVYDRPLIYADPDEVPVAIFNGGLTVPLAKVFQ